MIPRKYYQKNSKKKYIKKYGKIKNFNNKTKANLRKNIFFKYEN